jgi:hypothetical protein
MKYVLRHNVTGRYLKTSGVWVSGIDDAMTFDELGEAREYCQAHRIEDVRPLQLLRPSLITLLQVHPAAVTGA